MKDMVPDTAVILREDTRHVQNVLARYHDIKYSSHIPFGRRYKVFEYGAGRQVLVRVI